MTSPGTPRGFNTPDQDSGPRFSPVTPSSQDRASDRTRPAVDHPADFSDASNPSGAQSDSARQADIVRPQVAPPGFTEVTRDTDPSPQQPDSPATSPIQSGNGETPATGREAADEAPTTDTAGRWQALRVSPPSRPPPPHPRSRPARCPRRLPVRRKPIPPHRNPANPGRHSQRDRELDGSVALVAPRYRRGRRSPSWC